MLITVYGFGTVGNLIGLRSPLVGALEIAALATVANEMGKLVGAPTPSINALLGLVRLFARTRGLYPV